MSTPSVVVFDVNETLSDLAPMQQRFADVGAPGLAAQVWFASVLLPLSRDPDAAVKHIMGGFLELPVHPDVPDGVRALSASGARLVTLSNGSTEVAERLFAAAGIRDHFERLLSVEGAGVWKPAPAAYAYAASTCSVDPGDMLLVAVHPWDIDGAKRAGLRTAWVNRRGRLYPGYFLAPDHSIAALSELAGVVG